VVFTADAVDPYSPKTIRASAGALFKLRCIKERSFADVTERLRSVGIASIGASASASLSAYEADLTGPVAFVLGNEAWGLPADIAGGLDATVSVPMPGPLESLNVGIAGSLLLFEAVRQRASAPAVAPPG
jgi:tRNA G18 (ribose-2'-O)-methylase SpoU